MNLTLLIFFNTVQFLVIVYSAFNYYWDYTLSQLENKNGSNGLYDFIIVGAGSSGATLANRLSKNNRVLLLEAGGYPIPLMKVPGLAWTLLNRYQHDWMYKTAPQNFSCQAAENRVSAWPRGKVLGGSSALNMMQYIRSHPLDYDNWANITGDESWRYDNLLSLFKKFVNYNGAYKENKLHCGQSGNVYAEKQKWRPMEDYFLEAGRNLGFENNVDFNGPQRSGFGTFEFTTKDGARQDTYTAFLEPILGRSNLRIIHLDRHKSAYGVSYTRHGKARYARAKNEIIISAGAVDSPKLLLLSGIGPKKDLKSAGIKSISDIPVGESLHDHIAIWVGPFIINQTGLSYIDERDFSIGTITDYIFKGYGPLVNSAAVGGGAFVSSENVPWPNLQIYIGISEAFSNNIANAYGFKPEEMKKFYGAHYGKDAFNILVVLVCPKSRGHLKLRDKDPFVLPVIDPNYLQHKDDRRAIIDGIKFALQIGDTSSFKRLNATFARTPFPGCEMHKFGSNKYWECYVVRFTTTLYHPVGTCRMGKDNGSTEKVAVLDSKLRVHGVKSLRVADASIMPVIVNGNTNAACILIGEKAASIIREHWALQFSVCKLYERITYSDGHKCFYSKLV